jgi:hypothetical protein
MKEFEWHSIVVNNESVEYKTENQKFYIRLDKIDGAEVSFVDYKIFLLFAMVSLIGIFSEATRVSSCFSVLFFVGVYFLTRKLTLQIHGGNVVIKRMISGKDLSEAEVFLNNLKQVIEEKENAYIPYKKEA